jgi:hypothetical protein
MRYGQAFNIPTSPDIMVVGYARRNGAWVTVTVVMVMVLR